MRPESYEISCNVGGIGKSGDHYEWDLEGKEDLFYSTQKIVVKWLGVVPYDDFLADRFPMPAVLTLRGCTVVDVKRHEG